MERTASSFLIWPLEVLSCQSSTLASVLSSPLALHLTRSRSLAAALDAWAVAIAKEIEEAKHLREEAEKVLADYRRKEGDAVKEAEAIITLAAKEAEILTAETRRSMKEHFERRMKLAEDKIARAETEALLEVRAAAAEAAIAAAQRVIAEKQTPETADKLVKQGIDALKTKLN
jgi:F-type H+-transporting ATPase subunit b